MKSILGTHDTKSRNTFALFLLTEKALEKLTCSRVEKNFVNLIFGLFYVITRFSERQTASLGCYMLYKYFYIGVMEDENESFFRSLQITFEMTK